VIGWRATEKKKKKKNKSKKQKNSKREKALGKKKKRYLLKGDRELSGDKTYKEGGNY